MNLSLLGIIYNAKRPIALMSGVDGDRNQMVEQGQTISIAGQSLTVHKIRPDSVEITAGGQTQSFSLPSIVGFGGDISTSLPEETEGRGSRGNISSQLKETIDNFGKTIQLEEL